MECGDITAMSLYSVVKQSSVAMVARISSSTSLLIVTFVALGLLVSLLTYYASSERELMYEGAAAVFEGRDFSHTPFALMDAYDACLLESRSKFGNALLRSHMLPLSTRYDEAKQEYLVVLSADVGTVDEWNEAIIYCSIDPVRERISYYKEVHDGQQSILSKTMDMLNSVLK